MAKPGPKKGSTKSASHKRKLAKAVQGNKNGRYKDGRRSYRRIAGAKSGEVVHHKDGNRSNNKPSNLVRLKGKKAGTNTTTEHEKEQAEGKAESPEAKIKRSAQNLVLAYGLTNCSVHNVRDFRSINCVDDLSNDDLNYIEEEFNRRYDDTFLGYNRLDNSGFLIHKGFLYGGWKCLHLPFTFMGVPVMITDYE